jgi:D-sedoheptulose 7-phosphate isomerase
MREVAIMRESIERYWDQMADLARAMPHHLMVRAAEILLDCHQRGGTIFVVGNGGSAATASHFACDLSKGTRTQGILPFRVVPLTDNMPLVTAWANDSGYDRIFAEQLTALVRPGDVVVIISASGNSPNVVAAAEVARFARAITISMTGRTGGRVSLVSDLTIRTPSDSIEMVEDAHMVIAHSICVALRECWQEEVSHGLATEVCVAETHMVESVM